MSEVIVTTRPEIDFEELARTYQPEVDIANDCRNCGMCRIDYLDTGTCDAVEEHVNFAHHPHGRLKIFKELLSGDLPLTEEVKKSVESCTLCGKCNIQCYFQIELTPGTVFSAKKKVFKQRSKHEALISWEADEITLEMRSIVGEQWAFNDPAILTAYTTFGSLTSEEKKPSYVVLPKDAEETAEIVKLANKHQIKYLPISSGTNSANLMEQGCILIDMNRMKSLSINTDEQWAEVGAGILAFDLQKAVLEKGLRFSIGESPAGVCANQVSTGIHSFFAYKHGMMSDGYIEAELVSSDGQVFTQLSSETPQIKTDSDVHYRPKLNYICTKLKIRLHAVEADEKVIFIPFHTFNHGLKVLSEMAKNSIATAAGMLSSEILSCFMAMTADDAENFLDIAKDYLKINYGVLMLINSADLKKFSAMFPELTQIDGETMTKMILGLPSITGTESMLLIEDVMDEDKPYEHIFGDMLDYFLKKIEIRPDELPELFSHIDDKRLRKALTANYYKPEFSDMTYWFNHRMFTPRFIRTHWFFSVMHFTDADDYSVVENLIERHKKFGELHGIENYFCYIMPVDGGKRFFMEYEYFCDQRDDEMLQRLRKVFMLIAHDTMKMRRNEDKVYPVLNTLFNGLNKKDYYLYNNFDDKR